MKQERLSYIAGNNQECIAKQPKLAQLRSRLLDLGGEEVVLRLPEPDEALIMEHGQLWKQRVRMLKMMESNCELNTMILYVSPRFIGKSTMIRGYGLSKDGLWRQHCWLISNDTLIETTLKRVLYYGAPMELDAIIKERLRTIVEERIRAVG